MQMLEFHSFKRSFSNVNFKATLNFYYDETLNSCTLIKSTASLL